MTQFRVRTEQDLYTIEAVSYTIDAQGLKLTGEGGAILASFPAYESMVNVSAIASEAKVDESTDEASAE